ncbi:MAG: DUF6717 family protein [Opitutaceae bacterium]|jgi:hypothetical protein
MSGNSLIMLRPYKHEGSWVFDDDSVGLRREPFILGIDDMLDRMAESIPGAEAGFRLIVSARPFPGFAAKLEWQGEESGGNWYLWRAFGTRGWLCPALLKYFDAAPMELYAKAEPARRGGEGLG